MVIVFCSCLAYLYVAKLSLRALISSPSRSPNKAIWTAEMIRIWRDNLSMLIRKTKALDQTWNNDNEDYSNFNHILISKIIKIMSHKIIFDSLMDKSWEEDK